MGFVEEMSMSKIFLKFVNFRAFLVWENILRLNLCLKYCSTSDLQYGNVSKILGDYKKKMHNSNILLYNNSFYHLEWHDFPISVRFIIGALIIEQ